MKCLPKFYMAKNKPGYRVVVGILLVAFLLAILSSLLLGSVSLPWGDWEHTRRILLHVRLPRTAAAILAGTALAVSGTIIQSVMGNPLAGPNLIGVNSGAGLAAVLCAAFFPGISGLVTTASFLGALAAMLLIYAAARATGASRITLVLAGIAVSNILSAGIDTIVTLVPDALMGISAFRIGTLENASLEKLQFPAFYIALGLVLAWLFCHEMDILALGEDTARSLGLNTKWYRFCLLLTASMLAGAAVSFCGLLGFVGLIIPHAARFFTEGESRQLIVVSALAGGTFVLLCDVLARILFAPYEIPVGIIMSYLGGPFFLWLLIRRKGRGIRD